MPAGMITRPYLLAIGCLCATLTSHAQGTLILTPSSVNLTIGPYQDQANFTFPTPTVSLANYAGESVTFSAPSGYAWRFDPSVAPTLESYVCYGTAPSTMPNNGGAISTFTFVAGMASTVTDSISEWDSETAFGSDHHYQFGALVEFTALTVSASHYVSLDMYQRQLPLDPFTQAFLDGSTGQLNGGLTLVPIPEPGFATLNVLMLACAGIRLNLI